MSKGIYFDSAYKSLIKFNEELCGDMVEIVKNDDCFIVVLSDGLGNGVKANILSTLTSKIISTMMKEGASIEDTVDTVVHTLPVCNIRKVAYSTFSILQIRYDKKAYLVEFDSPGCILIHDGKLKPITYNEREISGKIIKEARFDIEVGDILTLISDGVIYAGIGVLLNLGWHWGNVSRFVAKKAKIETSSSRLVNSILETCNQLYMDKPGDDTTAAVIKIIPKKIVSIYSGPPIDRDNDEKLVNDFMKTEGIKIVCGGSSANIVSRILKEEIVVQIDYTDPEVPPIASIKGIDLVTEGVLTLKRTVDILQSCLNFPMDKANFELIDANNGAANIAKILMEECTHLNLFIGKKINPAHQNPNLPVNLSIKMRILDDLYELMKQAGKVVTRKFY